MKKMQSALAILIRSDMVFCTGIRPTSFDPSKAVLNVKIVSANSLLMFLGTWSFQDWLPYCRRRGPSCPGRAGCASHRAIELTAMYDVCVSSM